MVGNHKLHSKAFVMAMGNLATDNAYVHEMPAHSKSRQLHLYVTQDIKEWTDWAISKQLDTRVVSYAMSKPSTITKYDPDYVGINYPCARTMEMLSEQLKGIKQIDRDLLPLIQGTIGEGVGLEFFNFCALTDHLPDINTILSNPSQADIPTKNSYKYAMSGILLEAFTPENALNLMAYLTRMAKDYQYMVIKMAITSNPSLLSVPEVDDWVTVNANYFIK